MTATNFDFYRSPLWLKLRAHAIVAIGCRCQNCGRSPSRHGVVLEVHHIKPISAHPDLAAEPTNLEVLCRECHHGITWLAQHKNVSAANDPSYDPTIPYPAPENPRQLSLFDPYPAVLPSRNARRSRRKKNTGNSHWATQRMKALLLGGRGTGPP